MTGLEKITEQILTEAKQACEEQLAQTKKEAEQIISNAEKENEVLFAKAKEQADTNAMQMLSRGQSAASLKEKKMLLDAKQKIIQHIFDEAVENMQNMPVNNYFDVLLHMVDRYALSESGTICLSKQDLERMPDSFRKEIEKRQIIISEEPVRINGGFLLSYGDIEENCSFEALLAANRENLQDQIVRLIF